MSFSFNVNPEVDIDAFEAEMSGINWEAVTLVPEGIYHTVVNDVLIDKKPNQGNFTVAVKFKITSGPETGRSVQNIFTLTQKAAWFVAGFMTAAQINPVEYKDKGFRQMFYDTLGKPILLSVVHEEYNMKTYARVKDFGVDVDAPVVEVTPAEPAEETKSEDDIPF